MTELAESEVITFPQRLISVLDEEEAQQSIHWIADGRAFEIHNPKLFQETILKTHFQSIQLESFIVKLLKWGFIRFDKRHNRYFSYRFMSTLFRRDLPYLCRLMKLQNKMPKKGKSPKQLQHLKNATDPVMGQAIIYVPMPTAPVSVPQAVSGGQIQFLPQVELSRQHPMNSQPPNQFTQLKAPQEGQITHPPQTRGKIHIPLHNTPHPLIDLSDVNIKQATVINQHGSNIRQMKAVLAINKQKLNLKRRSSISEQGLGTKQSPVTNEQHKYNSTTIVFPPPKFTGQDTKQTAPSEQSAEKTEAQKVDVVYLKHKQPSKKPAHGVELTRPDYRQKAEVAVAMMGLAQVPTYSYRGEQFSN